MPNPQKKKKKPEILEAWTSLKAKLIPLIKNQQTQVMTHQEFWHHQQKVIQLEKQVQEYAYQINQKSSGTKVELRAAEKTQPSSSDKESIIKADSSSGKSYRYLPLTSEQEKELALLKTKKATRDLELAQAKSVLSTLIDQIQQERQKEINRVEQLRNKAEDKLTRVKDLILEKRWTTLQQLLKEGKI